MRRFYIAGLIGLFVLGIGAPVGIPRYGPGIFTLLVAPLLVEGIVALIRRVTNHHADGAQIEFATPVRRLGGAALAIVLGTAVGYAVTDEVPEPAVAPGAAVVPFKNDQFNRDVYLKELVECAEGYASIWGSRSYSLPRNDGDPLTGWDVVGWEGRSNELRQVPYQAELWGVVADGSVKTSKSVRAAYCDSASSAVVLGTVSVEGFPTANVIWSRDNDEWTETPQDLEQPQIFDILQGGGSTGDLYVLASDDENDRTKVLCMAKQYTDRPGRVVDFDEGEVVLDEPEHVNLLAQAVRGDKLYFLVGVRQGGSYRGLRLLRSNGCEMADEQYSISESMVGNLTDRPSISVLRDETILVGQFQSLSVSAVNERHGVQHLSIDPGFNVENGGIYGWSSDGRGRSNALVWVRNDPTMSVPGTSHENRVFTVDDQKTKAICYRFVDVCIDL